MASELREWILFAFATLAAILAGFSVWFSLKGRVFALEQKIASIDQSQSDDTKRLYAIEKSIDHLNMENARAQEREKYHLAMLTETKHAIDNLSAKTDDFQRQMIDAVSELGTKVEERTGSKKNI